MVFTNSRYRVRARYSKIFSNSSLLTWPSSTLISLMLMLCFIDGHCKVTSSLSSEKATIQHSDQNKNACNARVN